MRCSVEDVEVQFGFGVGGKPITVELLLQIHGVAGSCEDPTEHKRGRVLEEFVLEARNLQLCLIDPDPAANEREDGAVVVPRRQVARLGNKREDNRGPALAALPLRCLEVECFPEFAPKALGPIEFLAGPGPLDVFQVGQRRITAEAAVASRQTPDGHRLRRGGTPGRGRRRRYTNAVTHPHQ